MHMRYKAAGLVAAAAISIGVAMPGSASAQSFPPLDPEVAWLPFLCGCGGRDRPARMV